MARVFAIAALGACVLTALAAAAQSPLDGLFSRAQADRGAREFSRFCASCHTPEEAASLMAAGGAGQGLAAVHANLSATMPPDGERPSAQGYLDIIAHLSRLRGAALGNAEARVGAGAWREARVPAAGRGGRATAANLEWTAWRGTTLGQGWSPASQIDRDNVGQLEIAWRWTSANFGPSPESRSITTPLMAGGLLYATAGATRSVVALDPGTGETVWVWRPNEDPERYDNAPRKGSGRGVAHWTDGREARIFTVTPGFLLAALDARTGRPVPRFGRGGVIDLMQGLRDAPPGRLPDIGSQSPPLVLGDVVVVGPAHLASVRPRSRSNVKGDVRGYDARTGRLLWTFRTIPRRGDPFYDTWAPGTAEVTGNGGVWAPISGDPQTGAIFLPVEAGTSDFYGGERLGDNRHTTSLVSLDSRTGKVRWSQQLVRHDIWDWDVPAIPILADIPMAGGVRKAVLQVTKQSFVYAFDRDTGEPLWPMEERAVPASDVPGEVTAPTQRMPTLPLPFDRQGVTLDDLIDFTPALRAEAIEAVRPFRLGALMAPPSLAAASDGTRGTLSLPGIYGGANWEGGAYDPETGMLYVGSQTSYTVLALAPTPEGSDIRYRSAGGGSPRVRGLSVVKPPWGRITAIDMKSGAHAWMMANADTPAAVRDNPALAGVDLPRTGVASRAGLLVTRALLFAGEGASGSPVFRAHDKATGEILAQVALPGTQTGLPMTYVWQGRQYIVMAVAGSAGGASELVALALPR